MKTLPSHRGPPESLTAHLLNDSVELVLDVRDVDLIELIHEVIETTNAAAAAKGISIDTTLDPTVAATTGDATRLEQCTWNLLSNAIKFTPQGGRVAVSLGRSESHVEIKVSDNGIGIRSAFLPYVFDRFRQADASSSRRAGGLGLGLAIVKQLAELHGGGVRVESGGEGQGATFTLCLPVRALRADCVTSQTDPGDGLGLNRIKVLVVLDDVDNQEVLRRLLEQYGAAVVTAASAMEALEVMPTVRPTILVSDIGLPEMDGYELIRRVRQREPACGGRIPAIALTAHASSADRTKALQSGYQAHIAKPVQPRELVATIVSLAGLTAQALS